MEISQAQRISSGSSHPRVPSKTGGGRCGNSGCNSILGKQAMVPLVDAAQLLESSFSASQIGTSVAGGNSTSMPGSATSDSLVHEKGRLESLSCPV